MKTILLIILIVFSINSFATFDKTNESIEKLYHSIPNNNNLSMTDRIKYFSDALLNKPYILGGLGEGVDGTFDQDPLYRMDGFDCLTFVETVISLALANNRFEFAKCMDQIRYQDGQRSFATRNHFTSLDWNINAQKQTFLQDITNQLKDKNGKPVAKIAIATIDKAAWYKNLSEKQLKLKNSNENTQQELLEKLKQTGNQFVPVKASIPYIPLTTLFHNQKKPNQFIFNQIPDGAVVEIVRPGWDLRKKIGTCLNVSHLGFAIRKNGKLFFREASSVQHKTIDTPLAEYLKKAIDSPTIKGINIQVVVPEKPLNQQCKVYSHH